MSRLFRDGYLAPGTYYLGAIADYLGAVAESNENNNVRTADTGTITLTINPPTVTIAATDATATEAGSTTGTFTVSRTGSTAAALTVNYTVGGTATAGSDYSAPSVSVTIAAGSATAPLTITPAASYHVADVRVDGSSVGAVTTYTFPNVTANHTIEATFAVDPLPPVTIILTPAGPTTISPGNPMGFSLTLNNPGVPLSSRLQLLLLPEFLGREILLAGPVNLTLPPGHSRSYPPQPDLAPEYPIALPGRL